jgi:hypothetical protein
VQRNGGSGWNVFPNIPSPGGFSRTGRTGRPYAKESLSCPAISQNSTVLSYDSLSLDNCDIRVSLLNAVMKDIPE